MKIPVVLQLAALAVLATGFYTWVGQQVPQKEVHPPEVVEIAKDISSAEMAEIGKAIYEGKGICQTCHTKDRFPNLDGVATRAGTRIPGMSALEYFRQTLYEPDAFIVPGFTKGMPPVDKPPVGLTDDEIKTVIAYLQSLGGTPTITMDTDLFALDAPASEEGAAPAADGGGTVVVATPLDSYGCVSCHHTDQAGEKNGGPSLYNIGAQKTRAQILAGITDHEERPEGLDAITLGDLQAIVDYLMELKGNG